MCPRSMAIDEVALVEPAGLELARPMDERPVAAPFECSAGPAVHVEADLGRDAGTVDDQPLAKPERRGLLAEHHLGHGRAADVARADETDPRNSPGHRRIPAGFGGNAIPPGTAAFGSSRELVRPGLILPGVQIRAARLARKARARDRPHRTGDRCSSKHPSSKSLTNRLLVIAALAEGNKPPQPTASERRHGRDGSRAPGPWRSYRNLGTDIEVTGTSWPPVGWWHSL